MCDSVFCPSVILDVLREMPAPQHATLCACKCVCVFVCVPCFGKWADCISVSQHPWIYFCSNNYIIAGSFNGPRFYFSLRIGLCPLYICYHYINGNSDDNVVIKLCRKHTENSIEWMLICISWSPINFRNGRYLSQTWTSLQPSTDPGETRVMLTMCPLTNHLIDGPSYRVK